MKIGTVAGTNDSTTTIATNDMVQEHVTNFTKELFGYIANGIGDDISSIAGTMLSEVVEKIDDWQQNGSNNLFKMTKFHLPYKRIIQKNIVCYRACVLIFYVGIIIISLL